MTNQLPTFPSAARLKGYAMARKELSACVYSGRDCFAQKKTAALYAASHAYLVWKAAATAQAPQQARNWLRGELMKANATVAIYNTGQKNDRAKGSALLNSKLTEADLAGHGAADPGEEKKRLAELALMDQDAFNARLRVPANFKEADADISFNAVLRFVFDLYERNDSPLISRYAAVLGSIDEALGHDPNLDVQTIVNWLQQAGGFEAVLHARREQSGGSKSPATKSATQSSAQSEAQESEALPPGAPQSFAAETVTITMRVPSGWIGLPDRPFTMHCVPLGAEEIRVIGYNYIPEAELVELKAYFDETLLFSQARKSNALTAEAPSIAVDADRLGRDAQREATLN